VLIFLIAFVARTISVYHLTFLHESTPTTTAPDMHIEHWWRSLLSTGAIGFSVYVALMNAAVGISSPFFTVYMLRDLELSYFEFTMLAGTIATTYSGWFIAPSLAIMLSRKPSGVPVRAAADSAAAVRVKPEATQAGAVAPPPARKSKSQRKARAT